MTLDMFLLWDGEARIKDLEAQIGVWYNGSVKTRKQLRKVLISAWGGRVPTAKQTRHPSTQKQRNFVKECKK